MKRADGGGRDGRQWANVAFRGYIILFKPFFLLTLFFSTFSFGTLYNDA